MVSRAKLGMRVRYDPRLPDHSAFCWIPPRDVRVYVPPSFSVSARVWFMNRNQERPYREAVWLTQRTALLGKFVYSWRSQANSSELTSSVVVPVTIPFP